MFPVEDQRLLGRCLVNGLTCSVCRRVASEHFVTIAWVDLNFIKRLEVAGEIGCVVPAHRVDIRLRYLPCQGWVDFEEISEEVLESHEPLLLDYLCVDIRRAHRSNLGH